MRSSVAGSLACWQDKPALFSVESYVLLCREDCMLAGLKPALSSRESDMLPLGKSYLSGSEASCNSQQPHACPEPRGRREAAGCHTGACT